MTRRRPGTSSVRSMGCRPWRAVSSSRSMSIGASGRPPTSHSPRSVGLAAAMRAVSSACLFRRTGRMSPLNRCRENQRDGRAISHSARAGSSGASGCGRRSSSQRSRCRSSRDRWSVHSRRRSARPRVPASSMARSNASRTARLANRAVPSSHPYASGSFRSIGVANRGMSIRTESASNRRSASLPGSRSRSATVNSASPWRKKKSSSSGQAMTSLLPKGPFWNPHRSGHLGCRDGRPDRVRHLRPADIAVRSGDPAAAADVPARFEIVRPAGLELVVDGLRPHSDVRRPQVSPLDAERPDSSVLGQVGGVVDLARCPRRQRVPGPHGAIVSRLGR